MTDLIRIGIVGLGENTRLRHVPGFLQCDQVEIAAVCNRTPASTARAAEAFNIPWRFENWQELTSCREIDAVGGTGCLLLRRSESQERLARQRS